MGVTQEPDASQSARPRARRPQWTAALLANLAAVCAGTAVSWSSPTLPILQGESEDLGAWAGTWPIALLPHNPLSTGEGALVASLVPLGALVGALPAGALVHLMGMRRPLLVLAALFALGWGLIMLGGPGGVGFILAGRAVHGLATGAATVLVPRYCDEVAEVAIRGTLGALLDLSMCNGVLLVYLLALGLPYGLLTIVAACVPVIFAATFFFMPESPVYLAKSGHRKEALQALSWLRPGWGSVALEEELATLTAEDVDDETGEDAKDSSPTELPALPPTADTPPPLYDEVVGDPSRDADGAEADESQPPPTPSTSPPPSPQPSPRQPLPPPSPAPEVPPLPPAGGASAWPKFLVIPVKWSGTTAKGIFIVYSLMFLQQAAAISAVIAYSTQIFAKAGGALQPRVATVLLGALQSATGVIAAATVERAGRRPLLVGSSVIVGLSLAALALISADAAPWLPPVALGVYIGAFELGLGPLPWFITAELVGPTAGGGAVTVNWAMAAFVTEMYPGMEKSFGQRSVFGAFAVMAGAAVLFSLFLVPETRGKTRAQLREELRRWPRRAPRRAAGAV